MANLQPQITFFEMPTIQLKDGEDRAITNLRTNDPKLAQIQLAGSLRHTLPKAGINPEIKFFDMAIMNPENKIMFGTIKYAGKIIYKYRIGADFGEVESIIRSTNILCITANFTMVAGIVKDFIHWAKEKNPDATIIVGGTDATHRAEFYLKNGADFVVHGEGEVILHNLIVAILRQTGIDKVSGISFVRRRKVVKNEKSESDTPSLETLPFPALDLIDSYAYSESSDGALVEGVKIPMALIETSRGCNQKCSFCASSRTKGKYRNIPLHRLRNLLRHYKKYGINTVLLTDDSILSRLDSSGGRDEIIRIFREMRKMEFAWELFNGIEISRLISKNKIIDQELIDALFSHECRGNQFVGCYRAYLPLESVREDTTQKISKFRNLKNLHNKLDFDLEKKIIHEILKRQLPMVELGLIVCTPDEDRNYLELTYRRASEIKGMIKEENSNVNRDQKTKFCFHVFTDILLPGTPDYEKYKNKIVFSYDEFPELVNFATSVLNGDNLRYDEMFAAREKLFEDINGREMMDSFKATGIYSYQYP